ncbi:hypothetical protein HBI56_045060 [Parastagonospora nodorum]|uniref:Uncharacterized protein n=2 Tax=Phaeosphaeria nodorum (strain SN15 / ATCC MYA-4574 / FGSC 10173) TaxID=321614 RepID=A0A7U2ERW2_PHANO|nr:hypothetical protein SNOG_01915 [Parastagonospora nodorum SN15]KAH3916403.1 hypothetical protein HBH56_058180 [Parastagonospora nodorum]EAT90127.2 hypothetical protein SNOG_01915 [Parastagonospora nodorum SN15]KAH3931056.1 hypothetical protein HBH54_102110 [Parastagonospora nodorum]KAH3977441.1 hypothetical protein HBH52_111210 [Parastagonospora nodorum]KAH4121401.1 hypothetical protein HBH47_099070 [Parastagonospora nodorum]
MNGRFTAHHNPAVVSLRASNLNLMLIGYGKRSNDGTRAEVWADGLITKAELRLKALIEGDWQPIKWFEIAEFVPWISQIKKHGEKDEEKIIAIRNNWLLLYPDMQLDQPSTYTTATAPATAEIINEFETWVRRIPDEPRDQGKEGGGIKTLAHHFSGCTTGGATIRSEAHQSSCEETDVRDLASPLMP